MKKPKQPAHADWKRQFADLHRDDPQVDLAETVMQHVVLTPAPVAVLPRRKAPWWMTSLLVVATIALLGFALLVTSFWQDAIQGTQLMLLEDIQSAAIIIGFTLMSLTLYLVFDTLSATFSRRKTYPLST